MSLLELENVSYEYRNRFQTVRAVNSVSTAFDEGQMYAIVGKSGSGKTTLLSLLAGLDLPTSGEVRYRETPTKALDCDKYRREHASVIYQSYNLFLQLTALENVMTPLLLQKMSKNKAKDIAVRMLDRVGLDEAYYRRFPAQLSGGEQQRVAIARALAGESNVILADEPTGNLDKENGSAIINILADLANKDGRCVIVVTHDNSIAERADTVLTMSDGKLMENNQNMTVVD
jgi:putative ABC transport system ATP-binding protein